MNDDNNNIIHTIITNAPTYVVVLGTLLVALIGFFTGYWLRWLRRPATIKTGKWLITGFIMRHLIVDEHHGVTATVTKNDQVNYKHHTTYKLKLYGVFWTRRGCFNASYVRVGRREYPIGGQIARSLISRTYDLVIPQISRVLQPEERAEAKEEISLIGKYIADSRPASHFEFMELQRIAQKQKSPRYWYFLFLRVVRQYPPISTNLLCNANDTIEKWYNRNKDKLADALKEKLS